MREPRDIEHIRIAGGSGLNCMWPRYGGLWRWDDELLAAFIESPCAYRHPPEAARDLNGIWKRGYVRLRRSFDGGKTWDDDGKAFDNSISFDRQRQILRLDGYRGHTPEQRAAIPADSPDTLWLMGRAWCGSEIQGTRFRQSVAYCIRSADRGRDWETTPGVLFPHSTQSVVPFANSARHLGGGSMVLALAGSDGSEGRGELPAFRGPQLYRSLDHGASWHFSGEIWSEPADRVATSFPSLLILPSGRWLCVFNAWQAAGDATLRWTALAFSDDGGLNWSPPRKICDWSTAPFATLAPDGKLVVVFMRCAPDPTGLFVIHSSDGGERWTEPACLRPGTLIAGTQSAVDMGYPVAVPMADGRLLTIYDWQENDEDVPWYGGRSFIGGTFFRPA